LFEWAGFWQTDARQLYVVIGSAAVLAGYTRLSFCLAVLLMETTQNVNLFIPMLIGVMIARFVGSLFNSSLYKKALIIKHVAMTTKKVKDKAKRWRARDIMKSPVVVFRENETVKHCYDVMKACTYNGFPVITTKGKLLGVISRDHLIAAIENKGFFSGAINRPG